MNCKLTRFESDLALAAGVARLFLDEIVRNRDRADPFTVALSGGRIAKTFFAAVAGQAAQAQAAFGKVEFFWADERCVPPGDPESNFRLAREQLFLPLRIPEAQVHRIRGDLEPSFAAAAAEAELCQIAPLSGEGQPILDLVLLGMGEDGHVGSLFPGESIEAMANSKTYRAVLAPKPPAARITLGYVAIAAARQVWVLVSGAGKEAVLRKSLLEGGSTPLARVLASRGETFIFTERPQSSALEHRNFGMG